MCCHECLVQVNEKVEKSNFKDYYNYGGPSPDEITLVDAAKNMGYAFTGLNGSELCYLISENENSIPKEGSMELIKSFEFDSDRKRMSVLVKDGDVYKFYMKGADNIVKARLSQVEENKTTFNYLDKYSGIGLRTLLIAMKILS